MTTTTIQEHYAAPNLIQHIERGLTAIGKDRAAITIDDLAPVDEFHVRGAAATADLIALLAPTPTIHVLDLGAGLGGPARRLAQTTGCTVTGIDLSANYCEAATTLAEWCGLEKQVRFHEGNVTDLSAFPTATFDGAWTIHVGMNIADKTAFYSEVYRVLKPGGRFVLYDILTTGGQPILFPVPWAQAQETSFLLTVADMQRHLAHAGFDELTSQDWTTAGITFLQSSIARLSQQASPPPLGLHLAVGSAFPTMIQTLYQNLVEQRVQLAAIHCTKAA